MSYNILPVQPLSRRTLLTKADEEPRFSLQRNRTRRIQPGRGWSPRVECGSFRVKRPPRDGGLRRHFAARWLALLVLLPAAAPGRRVSLRAAGVSPRPDPVSSHILPGQATGHRWPVAGLVPGGRPAPLSAGEQAIPVLGDDPMPEVKGRLLAGCVVAGESVLVEPRLNGLGGLAFNGCGGPSGPGSRNPTPGGRPQPDFRRC